MPEVSVIVPVYKVERYLDRCVQSILNQTFKDFEVILVDDGSPDRCPAMCDEWAKRDSRITVLHQKNGGASAARNAGLRVAQGEYIGFVDSDDWIEPKMYGSMYELITANDADMVICEMQRQGKKNKSMAERVEFWDQKKCLDHFFRVNGEEDTHCIWNRLIKKEILEDFSFIEGKMNEDVHACYCFAVQCKKAVYTNAPYYHYTFNVNGVTNNRFTVKKMDLLYVWDKVRGLVANEVPEYLQVCDRNIERARFTLLAKMYFDGYDKRDKRLSEIKQQLKKAVRRSIGTLLLWKMPLSRKVLLLLICI